MEDKHDKVIFSRISWDAEYYASKMMGNGFDICDSEAYFDDDKGETKKRRKSMYGTPNNKHKTKPKINAIDNIIMRFLL